MAWAPPPECIGDFGVLVPAGVMGAAIHAFLTFCDLLGPILKGAETERGPSLAFLGIYGEFQSPLKNTTLTASLPLGKSARRAARVDEILAGRLTTHKDLECLTGRLHFVQTSAFGRLGCAMLTILYRKLNARFYSREITCPEAATLSRRRGAVRLATSRLTKARRAEAGRIIYTDAAAKTRIIASVVIDPLSLRMGKTVEATRSRRVGPHWARLFDATALIYGLEMVAIFAILFDPEADLSGRNITFYLASNNALASLLSNAAGPPAIAAMAQLIWFRIAALDMAVWPERPPPKKNIADLPTKLGSIPPPSKFTKGFSPLKRFYGHIQKATKPIETGIPLGHLRAL